MPGLGWFFPVFSAIAGSPLESASSIFFYVCFFSRYDFPAPQSVRFCVLLHSLLRARAEAPSKLPDTSGPSCYPRTVEACCDRGLSIHACTYFFLGFLLT